MPKKTVAIIQSNYIPWKGYFDIIRRCDEFLVFDEAQYTKRDWRNRNKIKTPQGLLWLTIPVKVKGRFNQRIDETEVENHSWVNDHLKALHFNYRKAPYYDLYYPRIEAVYRHAETLTMLSEINVLFLNEICGWLGITTPFLWSKEYISEDGRMERILSLCVASGATEYISGPAAKSYMDDAAFAAQGVQVTYMDYSGYPEYPQPHPPFEHGVSILDLLLNTGPEATQYLLALPSAEG